ncbi:diguanylate cyclase [Duganella sp. FT80W]|uniref:diguanylate cyclase n=1 Tax=Duganella guangzhouensis TaxID=2666084 RepID=A0A6I2KVA0_9BURK|nr:ligand-binding sensor domain-containing diguanylate cyclase [Duganella guangzhouensis]MRW89631.1 diguanylate cyclase [Duganella guangzhouensis]
MRLPGLSLCCCLLVCLLSPASAAPPARLPLTFESIESAGPDAQSVLSLLQDRQGYIWIGTMDGGLMRYNGRRATRYANDPLRPDSLPAGRINALYSDQQGRIWIGSDEGLARFEPDTNSFTRFQPDSAHRNALIVRDIASDGKQGMWLATWGGLQHFDPLSGKFKQYRADPARADSLASDDVTSVTLDADGGLWVATSPAGLSYLEPSAQGFTRLRVDSAQQPEPKLNDVRMVRYSVDGDLWIGTDAGLVISQKGTPWSARQRLSGARGRINNITFDNHDNAWISTRTEGLMRWSRDLQHVQVYTHRAEDNHSLPSNFVTVAMEDRNGTLWAGTFTDGVARANLGNYGLERIVPRDIAPEVFPSGNFVRSMSADDRGRIWLAADDSLALLDPEQKRIVRSYTSSEAKPGAPIFASVFTIYQQSGGPLWIASARGLDKLDEASGRFSAVRLPTPQDSFVYTVAPGRGKMLWIGTGASLIRYDSASGDMRRYFHDDADPASRSINEASIVLQDSQGRVWVGEFFRGGLDMMARDDGRFQHFRHDPQQPASISSEKISCLHEDMYGTIWIGTARGLNRMVPGPDGTPTFQRYTGPHDPGPILIESIQSDRSGMLWISTVRGLSRLDPNTGDFVHYSADDGVSDGLFRASSARVSGGALYFGGTTGITAVYPGLPLRKLTVPQVAISDIRIYDTSLAHRPLPEGVSMDGPVTAPRALSIPWTVDALTLEFAALHYAAPRRNSYAFWLEGFDRQWVQSDANQPSATYTNLNPGTYLFHLRAYTHKGLASEELLLPITVTPPFWSTWWFRTGAIVLVCAVVITLYRARVRVLTRHAARLKALVDQRTHELQESNRKLTALSATDGLTGLANRRSFDAALAREWGRAQRAGEPLALAMLDVDFFKLYNDSYGHQAGDNCLREVARVLAAGVHRATDVAARYGGEEFAFIAPLNNASQAAEMAEKIRAALQALAMPHQRSALGCVTISIGVAAIIPGEKQEPEMLLQAADQALYRAKENGRNCVMQTQLTQPRPSIGLADAL